MSQRSVRHAVGYCKKTELNKTIYVCQNRLGSFGMNIRCNESEDCGTTVERQAYANDVTALLLVLILLAGLSVYSIPSYMNNDGAKIVDTEYLIKEEVLLFTVKITYSYNQKTALKISVETSNPASIHDRTIVVGPGMDTKAVDFELKPLPSQDTWYVTVNLYESDEKGEKMEVLHMKNMDINLGEARLRGVLSTGLVPLLSVFSTAALIGIILYLRRRKREKKKLDKRKKRKR